MSSRLVLIAVLIATALPAQVTPTRRLPPADPVPFVPDAQEVEVMKPIRTLLAALETNDRASVVAVSRPEGGATVAFERPDGKRAIRHLSWSEFAAGLQPTTDRFEEKIGTPAIEIDGDIAMVWASYVSRTNGKTDHCGVDHFDLVRDNGGWKILNVTWSQRMVGCEP